MAVLGVMSTKVRELETVEAIGKRVDEASRYIDIDQLDICPPCGFASSFDTDRFTQDDKQRKLARLIEPAQTIWGE